jgi:secretion/DNA translocation related TadE-like protein
VTATGVRLRPGEWRLRGGRRGSARRPDQRGSAAVLMVVLLGVLGAGTLLLGAVGGAVVGQRRVESATDLAALAGAAAAERGEDACAAAQALVVRNGARLTACSLTGEVVSVRAARPVRSLPGFRLTVSSRARAGPPCGQGATRVRSPTLAACS